MRATHRKKTPSPSRITFLYEPSKCSPAFFPFSLSSLGQTINHSRKLHALQQVGIRSRRVYLDGKSHRATSHAGKQRHAPAATPLGIRKRWRGKKWAPAALSSLDRRPLASLPVAQESRAAG